MPKELGHHAALVYIMVMMSACDGRMTDTELRRIGDIVASLPVFADFDPEDLVPTAEECAAALGRKDGVERTLDLAAASLPEPLHETAYALACEVAAADLKVRDEEIEFLDILRDKLHLSTLVVAAIERGARARHRVI
jgi:tellurite resistance protein